MHSTELMLRDFTMGLPVLCTSTPNSKIRTRYPILHAFSEWIIMSCSIKYVPAGIHVLQIEALYVLVVYQEVREKSSANICKNNATYKQCYQIEL